MLSNTMRVIATGAGYVCNNDASFYHSIELSFTVCNNNNAFVGCSLKKTGKPGFQLRLMFIRRRYMFKKIFVFLAILVVVGSLLMTGPSQSAYAAGKPPTATPSGPTPTVGPTPTTAPATPISVFGAWTCGDHFCDWSLVRDMTEFDLNNHWLIDRGNGQPSVNVVVLAFANPLKMLNHTDTGLQGSIPIGMNAAVVNYFKSRGIRVMISIGGITYTDDWDTALGTDSVNSATATQLGLNAAAIAQALGVGIEIDYERSTGPKINAMQAFINAYRSQFPYDASGNNPAARLTIDLGAGDRWLIDLNRYATANWLNTSTPVLDYANAMVGGTSSSTPTDWQEHIDGKSNYSPVVLPLAPAKFTGSLYLKGSNANCTNYASSEQKADANYLQTVQPNGAGTTAGMLGFMFWAAEKPSSRNGYTPTWPPNSCEGGMGVAASTFNIPIPMPPLRQQ
jgi:hypothetical protein